MFQILGGSFLAGLQADRGTVDVYGGDIASVRSTNSTMTIFGTGFVIFEAGVVAPLFTGYGEIPEFIQGVIGGTLSNGAVRRNMPYQVGNNGRIVISMVPEPALLAHPRSAWRLFPVKPPPARAGHGPCRHWRPRVARRHVRPRS